MDDIEIKILSTLKLLLDNNPEKKYVTRNLILRSITSIKRQDYPNYDDCFTSLESLGLINQTKKNNSKQITITESGIVFLNSLASHNKKIKSNRLVDIFAILGAVVALILFLPQLLLLFKDLYFDFVNPSEYLIIQNSTSLPSTGYRAFKPSIDIEQYEDPASINDQDFLGCLDNPNCEMLILESRKDTQSVKLDLTSVYPDLPIVIEGAELSLINYQELSSDLINYYIEYTCGGGGGGGYSKYVVSSFPENNRLYDPFVRLSSQIDPSNPSDWIGQTTTASRICPNDICDEVIDVTDEEITGIEIELPFVNELPPGHYEFKFNINFAYKQETYSSKDEYYLDVIIPSTYRVIWKGCDETIHKGFATVDLENNSVKTNLDLLKSESDTGKLIFSSRAANDNGYYIFDLPSNKVEHIGQFDLVPQDVYNPIGYPETSNGGELWAFEIRASYDQGNIPYQIGLLDVQQKKFFYIQPFDQNRKLDPKFSPDEVFIAYVNLISTNNTNDLSLGEADIYIYDLEKEESKRVTFTPELIETNPVWINNNTLGFLIPEITVGEKIIQNSIGLEVLNIETYERKIYSIDLSTESTLEYLSAKNQLLLDQKWGLQTIFDIETEGFFVIDFPFFASDYGFSCQLLNTIEDMFLCVNWSNSHIAIYLRNQNEYILINEWLGAPNSLLVGRVLPNNIGVANRIDNFIDEIGTNGNILRRWNISNLDLLLDSYTHFTSPYFIYIPNSLDNNELFEPDQEASTSYLTNKVVNPDIDNEIDITIVVPTFYPPDMAGKRNFNKTIDDYINQEITRNADTYSGDDDIDEFINIQYIVPSSQFFEVNETSMTITESVGLLSSENVVIFDDIISVLLSNTKYLGGVHPGTTHHSINYDLSSNKELMLDDLFVTDAPYLEMIANYCIKDLKRRISDKLFDDYENNITPIDTNYQRWNLTNLGLMIVFEEYQVTPYVYGSQYVIVPYSYLKPIIDPNGPIGDSINSYSSGAELSNSSIGEMLISQTSIITIGELTQK